jgi:hypothetical protein
MSTSDSGETSATPRTAHRSCLADGLVVARAGDNADLTEGPVNLEANRRQVFGNLADRSLR